MRDVTQERDTGASRALHRAIEVCMDGEKTYAVFGAHVHDLVLQAMFDADKEQRASFTRAIQQEVANHEAVAWTEGKTKDTLHRWFTDARLSFEGRNDEAMLNECIRSETAALAP